MKYLVYKDLLLFFKDRKSVLVSLLLPIILTTFFAFIFGAVKLKNEEKTIKIALVLEEQSSYVDTTITLLQNNGSLQLTLLTTSKAEELFKKGTVDAIMFLKKGFSKELNTSDNPFFQLMIDPTKKVKSSFLIYQINLSLANFIMNERNKVMIDQSVEQMLEGMSEKDIDEMKLMVHETIKQQASSKDSFNPTGIQIREPSLQSNTPELVQAVSGTVIMLLLFSVINLGGSLLTEVSHGTFKRILVSPVHNSSILISKLITGVLISCLQLGLVFTYSILVLDLNINNHWIALTLLIGISALACSSFGVLFAVISSSKRRLDGVSTVFILVMSALGGSMVPLFLLPESVQELSQFSINYWFISISYDLFWKDIPFFEIVQKFNILLFIGVLMTTMAVFIFNFKLKKGAYTK